ncbi:unnamed protein product [Closterium sp. Naga37s-1]|nr:unnamed protein product [Closterium sp. Naga37s-1]
MSSPTSYVTAIWKREGGKRKSYGTGGCEEEEEAVAVIAGVLREKFGPQIVKEELEEWGSGIRSTEGDEGVGRLKEKEEGDEEEEEEVEEEEEEAEVEPCEEDAPPTTSPSTHPPPLNSRRVVSRSALLSLYRFFSSHLGISSPSTVAALLASKPQLLRSNPANDFLPRVRLLQSYGISNADVTHMTLIAPAWLRSSLQRIQNMLDFLLAKGIRRSRLGMVLRRGRNLLCCEARSTNLDILVERAGVPVDKLSVIIEKCPSILTQSKEAVSSQLGTLSSFFKATSGGKAEADSTSTSLLKRQLDEPQSTFLDTRFIATVLWRAPTILNLSTETPLAKLQFFVELVGEEATRRVAQSYPVVLKLSEENLQGKVAALAGLIGRENALRAVARFPSLLASSEDGLKESFRELVREVEEALESSGEEGSGMQSLDLRIRPRHVALVRFGYEVVAREMPIRTSVGGRRDVAIEAGKQRSKLCFVCSSLSDEVEGVEGIELGAENRKSKGTGGRQEQQYQGEDGDGTGGGVAATAAFATAASATAVSALSLPDLLRLFLWVVVSPDVAEELLFRGLLLWPCKRGSAGHRLGRRLSSKDRHCHDVRSPLPPSLSLLFPNMALGIAAGLLTV